LTVFSLPSLPVPGTGAAHGVHPTERFPSVELYAFQRPCPHAVSGIACSCSEDQEITMPRSSRALLPTEVRTRCGPRSAKADALMGFFASPERSPRGAHPASRARPSCAFSRNPRRGPRAGAPGILHARGQASPSRDRPALLRFSTRTCPRFLPMTVASCRSDPTGSEWAARMDPAAEAASARYPVKGTRRGTRRHPPNSLLERPGKSPPRAALLLTPLCQRETCKRAGPSGAVSGFGRLLLPALSL
jgi:hypothetical protein